MKKILAAACAALMAFALVSCGAPKNDNTLIMATNAAFPPYEYHEGGEIKGIDAEIGKAIADKLGMEFKIEDMEFDSIIPSVQSGKANFGMAGMTVSDERKESVNFSDSYATGIQVVIVKDDSALSNVDALFALKEDGSKWTVGVQNATTGDLYTTDDLESPKDENDNPVEGTAKIERYSKGADAVEALKTGKIDCVVIDNEPAKAFVAANEGLKILETEYAEEDYAIAIAKDKTELLEKVNKALKELKDDGTVQRIIDKYIPA